MSRCCNVTGHNAVKLSRQMSRFHWHRIKDISFCRATLAVRVSSTSLLQYCIHIVWNGIFYHVT